MASKGLRIGITDRTVQICVTNDKKRTENRIYNMHMFSTPEGVVNDGLIVDPAKLAAAIALDLEANNIKAKKAVFTLTSGKVAAREIKLPLIRDNKIKSVIETNASDYFPIDMTKYHISYALLERVEDPTKSMCRVMAYATPLAVLESYFKLAEELKIDIDAIEYAGNAVFESAKLDTAKKQVTTLYVDVGTTASFVTVIRDSNLLMSRFFPCGCDELISAYIATKNPDEADYCKALEELSSGTDEMKLSTAECAEYLARTVGNIDRFEEYFNSTFSQTPIEEMVITGTCSGIPVLSQLISESVGITATVAGTFAGFSVSTKIKEKPSVYLSSFASVLNPLDLIPPQFAKKKNERDPNSLSLSIIVLCAGVFIGIALGGSALFNYYFALMEQNAVRNEISKLEPAEVLYLKYADYKFSADGYASLKDHTYSSNDSLSAFIDELEAKMPSDIIVMSAACQEDGVNLSITVTSKESAATVISQLRTFQSISIVSVSSITETRSDDVGIVQVFFTVACTYGANPYFPAETTGIQQ